MNLLDEFLKKIEDGVDWVAAGGSSVIDEVVKEYKITSGKLNEEVIKKLKNEITAEYEKYKTFSSSVIETIRNDVKEAKGDLNDFVNLVSSSLGVENAYLRLRDIYTSMKEKQESAGEALDDFEKSINDAIEKIITFLSTKISNAEGLWEKYYTTQLILKIDENKLPSSGKPGGGSGGSSSSDGYGKAEGLYRPGQNDINWGQGGKGTLGMRDSISSFAGTDIVATINIPGKGPVVFGELSQLSYSIYREKVPIRTLGRITPKGYTRGLRTITGVLAFTIFDKSIVYQCMKDLHKAGYRVLMDELPTFDVTITLANEAGHKSRMTLYGISTYTEGQIMTVNSLTIQSAYEFYALDIDPMHRLDDSNIFKGTSVIDSNGDMIRETIKDYAPKYYSDAYYNSINQQNKTNKNNGFTFNRV